jgi:chaperone modulatory protein CbpM
MNNELMNVLTGEILEEERELTLVELCRACQVNAEHILELIEYGVVEPRGRELAKWRFHGASILRIRCVLRLERDLGINLSGAALALDLLDEVAQLRSRLRRFEG